MERFYSEHVFLLFLGGVFTPILGATIVFLKEVNKRDNEKNRLEELAQKDPEGIGDIEEKLNDSGSQKPNFFEILTAWGVQPLLIVSFASLFERNSVIEVAATFFLIIVILFHE